MSDVASLARNKSNTRQFEMRHVFTYAEPYGLTSFESMKRRGSPPSLLFRLIVPATSVFVVTILALIATLFGDPRAPVARWIEAHVNKLLLGEFIVVVVLSLLAMFVDRRRTIRNADEDPRHSDDVV